jgi:ribosomal protein S18 acetylase RimI-like enzyme
MIDDPELVRRSILGFAEMVAALGHWAGAEVRRPDAIGARIEAAAYNHWYDAVTVPLGATPPLDDPELPHCLWTVADAAPGRIEAPGIAMPCMGVSLDDPALKLEGAAALVQAPSLAELGRVNERAYGLNSGVFVLLLSALRDQRVRTYGLVDQGAFVSVALSMTLADDLSIQYVATERSHRRRGLAGSLVSALLREARACGLRSATLQASPEGLSVYERIGFRRLAPLRAYLRPPAARAQ